MAEMRPWVHLAASTAVPGYVQGLRQPVLRLILEVAAPAVQTDQVNSKHFAGANTWSACTPWPSANVLDGQPFELQNCPAWLFWLAEGLVRLQLTAGWTVFEMPVLEVWKPLPDHAGQMQAVLLVPGPMPTVLSSLLPSVLQALNQRFHSPADPAKAELDRWLKALVRWAPAGNNNRYILQAAAARGIPVLPLPGGVFLLGWGRHSRLFKSTITDTTSAVATAWAKDKAATNALLRMAGLPVPAQKPVASLEVALKAAQQMGYPVVLKPVDLDQGIGVEADLRDETQLRQAHARALRHGRPLLLEKHVPGEDFRVYVVNGELLGVAHRQPAQVVGDGRMDVAQLVQAENMRRQQAGMSSIYKPIELDEEARDLMSRSGLNPSSVLASGQVLRLRRSANSSRGGTSVDVTARIHPDNLALCVRAAAVLRLDIAGLDLLMPDVSRSWKTVGAAFCEVNAQPQMGGAQPWIFDSILQRYVVDQGRVPAVLVLGPPGPPVMGRAVAQALNAYVGSVTVVQGQGQHLLERTRAAIVQPSLGAVVVQTDGVGLAEAGLPLDAWDVLVLSGWHWPTGAAGGDWTWLARHVRGVVVWDEASFVSLGAQALARASATWPIWQAWAAQQPPIPGNGSEDLPRLQRVAGPQAVSAAVLRSVQALGRARNNVTSRENC